MLVYKAHMLQSLSIFLSIYTHTHTHTCMYLCMHACMYVCMYIHTRIHTHAHTHTHTHTHTRTHIYVFMHLLSTQTFYCKYSWALILRMCRQLHNLTKTNCQPIATAVRDACCGQDWKTDFWVFFFWKKQNADIVRRAVRDACCGQDWDEFSRQACTHSQKSCL